MALLRQRHLRQRHRQHRGRGVSRRDPAAGAELPCGVLNLSSVLADGSAPLTKDVGYQVYEAATDAEGNRKRIVSSPTYDGPPRFRLSAGRYDTVATYGSASGSAEVAIVAGEALRQTLNLHAGALVLSSIPAAGGKPFEKDVSHVVYDAAIDLQGNRKRVASSPAYEGPPRFFVPAGRYYVTAESGTIGGNVEVTVVEGQEQKAQLRLAAASR